LIFSPVVTVGILTIEAKKIGPNKLEFILLIACPVAWFVMNKWLQNFAYKTEMSWWTFALAGVIAMFIALITVSWQSWRAATTNPADILRNE